jgi:NhaP-type Na+/H+ or K+/H+ antiporter
MTRHWKSVFLLLVPVMTYGWLVTSLFIWWMIPSLSWLESLCCAACVTATDPVLASSVVGKGKFAKRIPKHLRDLLSAESGCNDGMAFPFIYLSLYLIKYRPNASAVFEHWFCLTVLYECVFGVIYGVCIGYAARHALKFAERKNLIDRESFLVFYFVLALWCAGTASMLGMDDLLVGFCAGVAFSNDGWFSQKTEESHVSNVIDLLLNLAFFVYFGAIIPWSSYNIPDWGITPWRLVVIAIMVILFRRIPVMVALKPIIPDIKTWREALFAGHFGPIGVGAVFVAILARAELETGETTPLAELPAPGHENYILISLIWPITTFLILASIIVHGSSIAVFTLGKHINTMRITMSYTTANEEPNWISRLPRLTPKTSMSIRKPDLDDSSEEKGAFPPGTLPPVGGIPGGFIQRQPAEEETPLPSRPASLRTRRRKNWEAGHGPGGPISDSAISPRRSPQDLEVGMQSPPPPRAGEEFNEKRGEVYQEGPDIIVENQDGDVIAKSKAPNASGDHIGPFDMPHPHERHGPTPPHVVDEQTAIDAARAETSGKHSRRRPAWAYRFDDNIVVEDEDGEVIRRYKLPKEKKPGSASSSASPWVGGWNKLFRSSKEKTAAAAKKEEDDDDNDDAKTVYSMHAGGTPQSFRMHDERGRRLSKQQFLQKLQQMDPHARAAMASQSVDTTTEGLAHRLRVQTGAKDNTGLPSNPATPPQQQLQQLTKTTSMDDREEETAAERRRREGALGMRGEEEDSDEEEGGRGRLEARGIQWGEDVKGKGRGE